MLTSTLSTETFLGNDTATEFPFHFQAWTNTDGDPLLRVYTVDPDGVATLTTDWKADLVEGGGTVTYPFYGDPPPIDPKTGEAVVIVPLATGWKLVILRDMDFLQQTDYVNGRAFNPETMESALDRLTAQDQQILEMLGRALLVSPGGGNPTDLLNAGIAAAAEAKTAQGAAKAAQLAAEEAEAKAKAAQIVAETARDSALAAAAGLSGARLDALDRGLAAEAYRRAMGDLVSARGYFLNGWIDPLADAGEVTITNGSFVAADGGYITNAGALGQVTALDLTAAQFLDEKGGITTFTVDTENTSGHFNAAKGARVLAGCRMVINGVSYPILSISGDGTAANSVVFSGTLTTGAKTVSGIYGMALSGNALSLAGIDTPVSRTDGTLFYSATITGTPAACFDGVTNVAYSSTTCAVLNQYTEYIGKHWTSPVIMSSVTCYGSNNNGFVLNYNISYTFELQGSNDNVTWDSLGSLTFTDTSNESAGRTLTATKLVPYSYHRVVFTNTNASACAEITFNGLVVRPVGVYPASVSVDCTDWTALKTLARTETLNSQNIWYALSFDGGTTYSAFASSAWLPIVRNNAGTWEYWTGSAWAASSINSALGAMAQAAAVEGNRMTGATMAGLSQAQIEGSGGFTGGQTSLPVLVALYSASSTATPVLSAMSMTSDIQPHDMVAEFDVFEAVDPDTGIAVFPMKAVDTLTVGVDLKAWLKRGSGAYQEITLHQGEQFDAAVFLYYGDVDMSAGTGDATQFKLTCHNHKELRVFMVENHFRSV